MKGYECLKTDMPRVLVVDVVVIVAFILMEKRNFIPSVYAVASFAYVS